MTYGHDAVLPIEINVNSLRIMAQNDLSLDAYQQSMSMELENVDEERVKALNNIMAQKKMVARAYNKKVKHRTFDEGDLVWKTILPLGVKDSKFGKWSPNWEGPYVIHKVLRGGAYHLRNLNGYVHRRKMNGRYLKKYHPTIWESIHYGQRLTQINI